MSEYNDLHITISVTVMYTTNTDGKVNLQNKKILSHCHVMNISFAVHFSPLHLVLVISNLNNKR